LTSFEEAFPARESFAQIERDIGGRLVAPPGRMAQVTPKHADERRGREGVLQEARSQSQGCGCRHELIKAEPIEQKTRSYKARRRHDRATADVERRPRWWRDALDVMFEVGQTASAAWSSVQPSTAGRMRRLRERRRARRGRPRVTARVSRPAAGWAAAAGGPLLFPR